MKKELEWFVYRCDINTREVEKYNIFKHAKFYEYLYKAKINYLKKDSFQFEEFIEQVRKDLMYCYWSKVEWEVDICNVIDNNRGIKVDVYNQVMLNWEIFREYLLNHYKDIKKRK